MVQHVKKLDPKLSIEIFGNPANPVVLEDSIIQIHQSWTDQRVPSSCSKARGRIRKSKTARIDVVDFVRVGCRVAGTTEYSIWESKCCLEPIQSDRVSGYSGGERKARAGLKQSIHLPTARDPSDETGFAFRFGQLPNVVNRRDMSSVKIRQAAIELQVEKR